MALLSEFPAAIIITIAVLIAGSSAARELRPSDHGLNFQASPPANSSAEMKSFFSGNKDSTTSSSSSYGMPIRNATESLPPSWRATGGGGGHLGRALTIASLVCGITGGVLLVATGLLYVFKHRSKPNPNLNDSFRSIHNSDNNNANKLQLEPVP